jgi:16S rRNA U516 pseudouridylate synthase RsuA-like enzyme
MFLTEGYTVVKLKRLREGSILLPDDLAEGCFKKVEKMV